MLLQKGVYLLRECCVSPSYSVFMYLALLYWSNISGEHIATRGLKAYQRDFEDDQVFGQQEEEEIISVCNKER